MDYANVFASLEKALAIYGAGKGARYLSVIRRNWLKSCGML
jgi:hypothetical protein